MIAMHLAERIHRMSPHNAGFVVRDRQIEAHDGSPRRKKICIYGAGLYQREAPLADPSWEVWALNLCAPYDPAGLTADRNITQSWLRADIWFDLHQREAQSVDDLRWIATCPMPIYVPPDLEDASPNAVHFPIDEIEARFGSYFACTFAYQMALVLYEGIATDLGLYGVELAYGTERERTVEWACVSYWLGRVAQAGVNIWLPRHSSLGQHLGGRYGFEYARELAATKQYVDGLRRRDSQLMDQRADQEQDAMLRRLRSGAARLAIRD